MRRGKDKNCWQGVKDYILKGGLCHHVAILPAYAIRLGCCIRDERFDLKELLALMQDCIHLCSSTCFTGWRTITILAASLNGTETHLRRMIPQDGIGAVTLRRGHGTCSKRLLYLAGPSGSIGEAWPLRKPCCREGVTKGVAVRRFLRLTSPVRLW